MHPALRKGPLFLQKTPPPIFHFFKDTHFISCLRAWFMRACVCLSASIYQKIDVRSSTDCCACYLRPWLGSVLF